MFVKHALGGTGLEEVLDSRRLQGFALEKTQGAPQRKQAPPFKPSEILLLQTYLYDEGNPVELRVLAGAVLLLIAVRGRFADLNNAIRVDCNETMITVVLSKAKTTNKDKSRLPIALVGPRYLCGDGCWYSEWCGLKELVGIGEDWWPLMPAFVRGEWLEAAVCQDDFNSGIKVLCKAIGLSLIHI